MTEYNETNGRIGIVVTVNTPVQDTLFTRENRLTKGKNMVQYISVKNFSLLKLSGLTFITVSELEKDD